MNRRKVGKTAIVIEKEVVSDQSKEEGHGSVECWLGVVKVARNLTALLVCVTGPHAYLTEQ